MDILGADDCAELARRIRDGDRAAEARFARLYCDCVFAMALARTRDRRHLGGFVHGTAINTINAYFRRRSRLPRTIALDPTLAAGDATDECEAHDRRRTVRAAMAPLDARDRRILQLSLAEGLKPGEIAARLSLSSVVVRQRKCRALRAIVLSDGDGGASLKARGMLRR